MGEIKKEYKIISANFFNLNMDNLWMMIILLYDIFNYYSVAIIV